MLSPRFLALAMPKCPTVAAGPSARKSLRSVLGKPALWSAGISAPVVVSTITKGATHSPNEGATPQHESVVESNHFGTAQSSQGALAVAGPESWKPNSSEGGQSSAVSKHRVVRVFYGGDVFDARN